jgi:hypothetical protein
MAEHPNITINSIYNTWADHQKIVLTWRLRPNYQKFGIFMDAMPFLSP